MSLEAKTVVGYLRPANPRFRTVNGMGYRPFGKWKDGTIEGFYFKMGFVSLFFVPILPLSVYLMEEGVRYPEYRIVGSLSVFRFTRIYGPSKLLHLWATSFVEGAIFILIIGAILAFVSGAFSS